MKDELLIIKQIINVLCKKYHWNSLKRKQILNQVIADYWGNDRYGRGLAYVIFRHTQNHVSETQPLTKSIMTAIQKYQPNNMYNKFKPFVKSHGLWYSFQDEMVKHRNWTIDEMFCNAPLSRIVDCSLIWNATPQGFRRWEDLNRRWSDKVMDESNKPTQEMTMFAQNLVI